MQELKISKSKELLTNSEMNCQQIAYAVGFETPSYFNIVFKKKNRNDPFQIQGIHTRKPPETTERTEPTILNTMTKYIACALACLILPYYIKATPNLPVGLC